MSECVTCGFPALVRNPERPDHAPWCEPVGQANAECVYVIRDDAGRYCRVK